jgi:methylenetetrahydrofolate reductase (NADPH)
MDKITDKIAGLPPGPNVTYTSLEFFPPKTAMGFANLRIRLERMQRALKPLFVNVTWGAGGSTAQKSLELAEICQRELGMTTCLHLTCTNMSRRLIDKALEDAKALGIRNILALRGDPPRPEEYRDRNEPQDDGEYEFVWAVDLVRYIRKTYGDYFCIGVAAYPEGHADESNPVSQSVHHDLPYIVEKVKAGADFIITQLFFDTESYDMFERQLREHPSGLLKTLPIIPGLMPIQGYQMIKRVMKLSHASFPPGVLAQLDAVKGDDEKVKMAGVDILIDIIEKVKKTKARTPGPMGFHFYTLNLEKVVSFVLERASLIPAESDSDCDDPAVIDDLIPGMSIPTVNLNGASSGSDSNGQVQASGSRRGTTVVSDPHNRVIVSGPQATHPSYEITQHEASLLAEPINSRANTLAISEGTGDLGREATWDDYPNGRFGDARSPAYGEIDGYGVSIHMSTNQAVSLWGYPKTKTDISALFTAHIRGELSAIPWSEEGLRAESSAIREHLLHLNEKGWWTVASQPAVDGVSAKDPTFGWGPDNGFVFQKAFVEFFLPSADWDKLKARLLDESSSMSFYAADAEGNFTSSDETGGLAAQAVASSIHAVTWGVFPGKEIVSPTIIEEVSFRAWREEAFGIWAEWAKVYPRGSESEALLESIRGDYLLVNIIHHEYKGEDGDKLWKLLAE